MNMRPPRRATRAGTDGGVGEAAGAWAALDASMIKKGVITIFQVKLVAACWEVNGK
jgi:hypothetical protein